VTSLEGVVSAQTRRRALIGACVAWLLAMGIVTAAACISGCGTASRVGTGAACASLIAAIGERTDYAPARALADIDSTAEVCRRLQADAGAP